jgi:hypothetical protein
MSNNKSHCKIRIMDSFIHIYSARFNLSYFNLGADIE